MKKILLKPAALFSENYALPWVFQSFKRNEY